MNIASSLVATAPLTCGAAAAQDFTGRWAAAADTTEEAGTRHQEKQTFYIKMVGAFSTQHNRPKKWIYERIGAMTLSKDTAPAAAPAAK